MLRENLTKLTTADLRIEVTESKTPCLVVVKKEKAALPCDNYKSPFDDVRLVVHSTGMYQLFCYHFELVKTGTVDVKKPEDVNKLTKDVLESHPCAGVPCNLVDKLGYLSTELREDTLPWRRVSSKCCTKLAKDVNGKCYQCKQLEIRLERRVEIKTSLSSAEVKSRQSVSSKIPLSVLSPTSKQMRLKNMRESRKYLLKRVRRYRKKFSVLLSNAHSSDLALLMNRIDNTTKGIKELERCVKEAENVKKGSGTLLREVWNADKDKFLHDQRKNGKSKSFLLFIVHVRSPQWRMLETAP